MPSSTRASAQSQNAAPSDRAPAALAVALLEAALDGDIDSIAKLLDAGANVNAAIGGDGSPLIGAAREGRLDAVRLLLDRGADVDMGVQGDGNALIMAAREGHVEVITMLLDRGASIDHMVPGDENALIQASGNGRLEVVKLLVSRGANVNARVWAPYSQRRGVANAAKHGSKESAGSGCGIPPICWRCRISGDAPLDRASRAGWAISPVAQTNVCGLGKKGDREMRLTQWLEELRDDVKFAIRQLRTSPAFTFIAAITLALGIGGNSAIFALVDATLLRPLPFREPERLVMVWETKRHVAPGRSSAAQPSRLERAESHVRSDGGVHSWRWRHGNERGRWHCRNRFPPVGHSQEFLTCSASRRLSVVRFFPPTTANAPMSLY